MKSMGAKTNSETLAGRLRSEGASGHCPCFVGWLQGEIWKLHDMGPTNDSQFDRS